MTLNTIRLDEAPKHRSFRLTRPTPAPLLDSMSSVRPAIILPDREARLLLASATQQDVSRGGHFSAGPAGVQLWSGPWDGSIGSHGSSQHLGSVDWSYDTPTRHYITIYRVLLTSKGAAAGLTTHQVLEQVLALAGLNAHHDALVMDAPPARDPFRSESLRQLPV